MEISDGRRREVDGVRALAVLAVAFSHACKLTPGPLGHYLDNVGSHGVDVFFVLSGFCLAYPELRAKRDGRPLSTVAGFLRRRLVRIAPPYYVAILAFGALAFTGFSLPLWPLGLPTAELQLRQLAEDAAFITSSFPMHNSDFWTLGIEMHWYLLFPFILRIFVRSKAAFTGVMVAAVVLYRLSVGTPELGVLPCFMFGIVAAELAVSDAAIRRVVWPFALVFFAYAGWQQYLVPERVDHGEQSWQIASFLLVIAVTGTPWLARVFSHRALVATGIASYSIYLVHHPILKALALRGVPVAPALAIALATGFAFWYLVERPLLRRDVRAMLEDGLRLRFGGARKSAGRYVKA